MNLEMRFTGKCDAAQVRSRYDGVLRSWRQIAQELFVENDAKRRMELALELIEALRTDSGSNAHQQEDDQENCLPQAAQLKTTTHVSVRLSEAPRLVFAPTHLAAKVGPPLAAAGLLFYLSF